MELHKLIVKSLFPVPVYLYHTPGDVIEAPQGSVGSFVEVAPNVVPAVDEGQVITIAFSHKSFAGTAGQTAVVKVPPVVAYAEEVPSQLVYALTAQ